MLCSLPLETDGAISVREQQSFKTPSLRLMYTVVNSMAGDISCYVFGMFLPLKEIIPLLFN